MRKLAAVLLSVCGLSAIACGSSGGGTTSPTPTLTSITVNSVGPQVLLGSPETFTEQIRKIVSGGTDGKQLVLFVDQMEELAEATGSTADTDGDGVASDLLVYTWYGSDDDFRESIVGAISDLLNSITFDKVSLAVQGDTWGFVQGIDPAYYDGFEPEDNGEIVEFTLYFTGMVAATTNDQLFDLELIVLGDDSVALDKLDIIVVVPGTSY